MTDESPVTETASTGVSIEMPVTTPITEPTTPDFKDIIPKDDVDKPRGRDVKDVDGFFKMTDDLKSEMGKRPAGIPQSDASEEQWGEFNKSFGVPSEAAGYQLEDATEGMQEYNKLSREAYLKAGISQRQAAILHESNIDILEQLAPDAAAQDAEFDELTKETFGDRKVSVMSVAEGLLAEMTEGMPEAFKDVFNNLPNKQLVAIAFGLDKFQSKYINSDDLPSKDATTTSTAMTSEDKRREGVKLMASPEWGDKSHPGHAAAAARVKELYGT